MFTRFSPETIRFIVGLSLNNEKPWFETHKSEYQQFFLLPMKSLAQEVFDTVSSKCPNHNFTSKVSRIHKDARYLRPGEDPYRTSLWFSIEKPRLGADWTDTPVFWFELSGESWSYGMGYGGAKAATMEKFRASLDKNPKQFEKIIAFLDHQKEFVLDGEDYKREKEAPSAKTAPWYNKKSFSLIYKQKISEELFSPSLANQISSGMLSLMPVYDYLIKLKP